MVAVGAYGSICRICAFLCQGEPEELNLLMVAGCAGMRDGALWVQAAFGMLLFAVADKQQT